MHHTSDGAHETGYHLEPVPPRDPTPEEDPSAVLGAPGSALPAQSSEPAEVPAAFQVQTAAVDDKPEPAAATPASAAATPAPKPQPATRPAVATASAPTRTPSPTDWARLFSVFRLHFVDHRSAAEIQNLLGVNRVYYEQCMRWLFGQVAPTLGAASPPGPDCDRKAIADVLGGLAPMTVTQVVNDHAATCPACATYTGELIAATLSFVTTEERKDTNASGAPRLPHRVSLTELEGFRGRTPRGAPGDAPAQTPDATRSSGDTAGSSRPAGTAPAPKAPRRHAAVPGKQLIAAGLLTTTVVAGATAMPNLLPSGGFAPVTSDHAGDPRTDTAADPAPDPSGGPPVWSPAEAADAATAAETPEPKTRPTIAAPVADRPLAAAPADHGAASGRGEGARLAAIAASEPAARLAAHDASIAAAKRYSASTQQPTAARQAAGSYLAASPIALATGTDPAAPSTASGEAGASPRTAGASDGGTPMPETRTAPVHDAATSPAEPAPGTIDPAASVPAPEADDAATAAADAMAAPTRSRLASALDAASTQIASTSSGSPAEAVARDQVASAFDDARERIAPTATDAGATTATTSPSAAAEAGDPAQAAVATAGADAPADPHAAMAATAEAAVASARQELASAFDEASTRIASADKPPPL
jgi:hypothetical protein